MYKGNSKVFRVLVLALTLVVALSVTPLTAFALTPEEEAASKAFDAWLSGVTIRSAGKITFGSSDSTSTDKLESATSADLIEYAKEVFELVNKERSEAGLDEVVWDIEFAACARIRADELQYKYSHERPSSPKDDYYDWPLNANGEGIYNAPSVADEQGIEHKWIMENIAAQRDTPEATVKAWMDSTGHRNNILKDSHTRCGVGVYYSPEKAPSGYNWYWVVWFDNY